MEPIKSEWLREPVGVAGVEAFLADGDCCAEFREEGRQFLAQQMKGDEIWKYRSPLETWVNMCGREGFALVRNKQVIDTLVTLMN